MEAGIQLIRTGSGRGRVWAAKVANDPLATQHDLSNNLDADHDGRLQR
jgi:hypothetical protein